MYWLRGERVLANCYACKAEIVFDNEHIGKNGRKIPLDPFTKQPHDCPMREKKPFERTSALGQAEITKEELEEKDDHGNEPEALSAYNRDTYNPEEVRKNYVDHTQPTKGQSKVKIFEHTHHEEVEAQYNKFLQDNNGKIKTQGAQFHIAPHTMAIALYYEEVATK